MTRSCELICCLPVQACEGLLTDSRPQSEMLLVGRGLGADLFSSFSRLSPHLIGTADMTSSCELSGCLPVQVCEALPGGSRPPSEMLLVGRGLIRDFERYGVHLGAGQQQQLAAATQAAHTTGMQIGGFLAPLVTLMRG